MRFAFGQAIYSPPVEKQNQKTAGCRREGIRLQAAEVPAPRYETPLLMMLRAALLASVAVASSTSVVTHQFFWRGQFAGFIVSGKFSYDQVAL